MLLIAVNTVIIVYSDQPAVTADSPGLWMCYQNNSSHLRQKRDFLKIVVVVFCVYLLRPLVVVINNFYCTCRTRSFVFYCHSCSKHNENSCRKMLLITYVEHLMFKGLSTSTVLSLKGCNLCQHDSFGILRQFEK